MPHKQQGELFGKFQTGRPVEKSYDVTVDVEGLSQRPRRPFRPKKRSRGDDQTRAIRKEIVYLLSRRLDREAAISELVHLSAVAHLDPPIPDAAIASYAGTLLARARFTQPELAAIHDGLIAKISAVSAPVPPSA